MASEPTNASNASDDDALAARILDAMEPGVRYARGDLIDMLELTPAEWKQAVGELVEKGLVRRTGERRGTRYERLAQTSSPSHGDMVDTRGLSEEARLVLGAMQPEARYARKDLLDATGVSVATWNRVVNELLDAGVVEREGERRGTRYVIAAGAAAEPPPEPEAPDEPEPEAADEPGRTHARFETSFDAVRETFGLAADARVEAVLAARGLPAVLWPTVSALANSGGGAVILGARQRSHTVLYIKGLHKPKLILEALYQNLERQHVLQGVDEREVRVAQGEFAHRRVVAVRVPARPKKARPVYVGANAYARAPTEGTFIWQPGVGVRKCTTAEIDALWDAWAEPYRIVREDPAEQQTLDDTPLAEQDDEAVVETILREVTGPARRHPSLGARRLREVIVRACGVRPLTLGELSELLRRKAERLEREHLEMLLERQRIVQVDGHFCQHSTQLSEADEEEQRQRPH